MSDQEETLLVRPTSELRDFIKLLEEADEFTKSQLGGIIKLSPRPKWFIYKSIKIIKTWKEVTLKYLETHRKQYYNVANFLKYFIKRTYAITGLDIKRQLSVLTETLTFLEYHFRTSPTAVSVVKTGFVWFISQKLELVYQLQGWVSRSRPSIIRTGVEGEQK